jgi:hypothetical protein
MPRVTLGGQEIELGKPESFGVRAEIARAAGANWARGCAAALAACWRGKDRPKTTYASCDYNPLVFGLRVIDELVARGIPYDSIVSAGEEAWKLCAEGQFPAREVAATEGFSEPPQGA